MGLNYYTDMKDATLSDLLRQANTSTASKFMYLSDSSWQDCLDTGRSTGEYIIFYKYGKIDHGTHVPVPVAQSSAESEYNAAYTSRTELEYFRILIHKLFNKDLDIVPKE